MADRCAKAEDVMAYLQGEMSEADSARFATHAASCAECGRMLADCRALLGDLRAAPIQGPRKDMAPAVVAEIAGLTTAARRRMKILGVAAAACVVVAAVAGFVIGRKSIDNSVPSQTVQAPVPEASVQGTDAVSMAVDWLAQNQEKDGKWAVGKFGGNPQYEIGISALAVMALSGCEPATRAKYAENVRKGANFLLSRQTPAGRFSEDLHGTMYNHAIATVCLIEVYATEKDERLKEPIRSALACIRRTQLPGGGWGYFGEVSEWPNSAVSLWALQALLWADAMGFEGFAPTLQSGFTWLAGLSDDRGRPGYRSAADFPYGAETLSAMAAFCYAYGGAKYAGTPVDNKALLGEGSERGSSPDGTDFYGLYFQAYAGQPEGGGWYNGLAKKLTDRQSREIGLLGSWDAADHWGYVGGRVYATAFAALILEMPDRAPWLKRLHR
jgi:hypothetical protein